MPRLARVAFRLIGGLNVVLSAFGLYLMLVSISRFWRGWYQFDRQAPYFGTAFVVMTLANFLILAVLLTSSVRLVRLTEDSVRFYWVVAGACVLYSFVNGALWGAAAPIGISIASASGVGNMGLSPFESFLGWPYLYPILSASVLLIAQKQLKRKQLQAES